MRSSDRRYSGYAAILFWSLKSWKLTSETPSVSCLDCPRILDKVASPVSLIRRRSGSSYILSRSIDERTLVYFSDNPQYVVKAYVDSGEGIDRAGGFAIQVCSSSIQLSVFPVVNAKILGSRWSPDSKNRRRL